MTTTKIVLEEGKILIETILLFGTAFVFYFFVCLFVFFLFNGIALIQITPVIGEVQ